MKERVSIKDVAKEAGVSASTVSYILSGNPNVSFPPETKERVFAAAKKLNYVVNRAAKTLRSGRVEGSTKSNLIGIVIPQTESTHRESHIMFGNPFYGAFLSAVELEIRKAGFHLLLSGTTPGQSYIDIVRSRTLDGVIILGAYPSKDADDYKRYRIPAVLVDCYGSSDSFFYSVRTDDRLGGYIATKYLIEQGHRNIGIVTGELKEHGVNQERCQGYLDALNEAGIVPKPEHIFEGYVDHRYGMEVAEEIAEKKQALTAIFATSDIAAIGLINGLQKCGLSVPSDISVVGFDDIEYATMCFPGLTTVRQNIMEKGKQAAQLILATVQDHSLPKETRIIPMELVERGTVRSLL